jgi:hypothetical protein
VQRFPMTRNEVAGSKASPLPLPEFGLPHGLTPSIQRSIPEGLHAASMWCTPSACHGGLLIE